MLLDFLMPALCAACRSPGGCLCPRCAAAIATSTSILRGSANGVPPVTALGAYDGTLRAAILALKFGRARALGARLGRWLAPKILLPFEAVVPVPLHTARLRERGYNQAAEIANAIGAASRRPVIENALERNRVTAPQSALDLIGRRANVEGAFAAGRQIDRVCGARVLLVDDVITTGATIRACADALRAAGVRAVYAACAAARL
jgi:ComF family protein